MRIRELLAVESIDLNAKAASKKEALDHAVDLMARSGKIERRRDLSKRGICKRGREHDRYR